MDVCSGQARDASAVFNKLLPNIKEDVAEDPAVADVPVRFNVELLEKSPNREDTVYRSKAVGEPPLMLAISAWCAIRDAVASMAEYRMCPLLDAPATPEHVLNAIHNLEDRR